MLLEPGVLDRGAEERQGVHPASTRVNHVWVVVLPASLVLLRTVVVVDSNDDLANLGGRSGQVDGRFAAIGANLADRADGRVFRGRLVQCQPLGGRHESARGFRSQPELV